MARLTANPLKLEEIANYYNDCISALTLYFSDKNPRFEDIFAGETSDEVSSQLHSRIEELNRSTSLSLLALIEAIFMMDCKERDKGSKDDVLSIALIACITNKKYILLNDRILDVWKENIPELSQELAYLKGALKYRHWLAHGRHFTPNMGRADYDYSEIYQLTELILKKFPFEGI